MTPTKEFMLIVLMVIWTHGLYDLSEETGSRTWLSNLKFPRNLQKKQRNTYGWHFLVSLFFSHDL